MTNQPKVWLVRAGGHGEDEELCLSSGRAVIGWQSHGDLSKVKSLEATMAEMRSKDTSGNEHRLANRARQFWAFRGLMQLNDIVVLPLKTRAGQIALGMVEGDYEYVDVGGTKRHTRRVKWIKPDVPRSTFKQDLLYSFGAFMTVCRIQRNQAEERVAQVLKGKPDPGYEAGNGDGASLKEAPESTTELLPTSDLEQAAQDEVVAFIRTRFQAHDLARLVGAILGAEGYVTQVSPPARMAGRTFWLAAVHLGWIHRPCAFRSKPRRRQLT